MMKSTLLTSEIESAQPRHTDILKMGRTSFLDYYKTILKKVSFDSKLIEKEYRKAKQLLMESERKELDMWLEINGLIDKFPSNGVDNKETSQPLQKELKIGTPSPAIQKASA